MNHRQLQYFVTLADELHFGRAADRLRVSQPALSQTIRVLERELGGLLFQRTRRQVVLTDAGAAILDEARRTLAQYDALRQAVDAIFRGESGRLVIGFIGATAAHDIVPDIVRQFRDQYPDVVLELREMVSAPQVAALRAREIQLGFIRTVPDGDDLVLLPILSEPLIVALDERSPLASRPAVDLSELAGTPLILFPRHLAPLLYDQIIGACRQAGFEPHVAQEAVLMQTTLGLIAAGIGAAFVPASAVSFQRTGVVHRTLSGLPITIDLYLAYRRDGVSPAAQRFIEVVGQVAGYRHR